MEFIDEVEIQDEWAMVLEQRNARVIDAICSHDVLQQKQENKAQESSRIQDGLCGDRIKTSYSEGKGDFGYSTLIEGHIISKASRPCKIYGAQEELQSAISKALIRATILNPELEITLGWLRDNLHSLGAFAFSKAGSTRHVFPISFLDYMMKRIGIVKSLLGPSKDFIIWECDDLLYLNDIRVGIRAAESSYWAFFQSEEMSTHLLENPYLVDNAKYMGKILNRASAWCWQEIRYEAYLRNLEMRTWEPACQPFPL